MNTITTEEDWKKFREADHGFLLVTLDGCLPCDMMQVEFETVSEIFPYAVCARMDSETGFISEELLPEFPVIFYLKNGEVRRILRGYVNQRKLRSWVEYCFSIK